MQEIDSNELRYLKMSSGSTYALDGGQGTPLSCNSAGGDEIWSSTTEKGADSRADYGKNLKSDIPSPPVVPLNCIPLSAVASKVTAAATSQILGIIEEIRGQTPEERRSTIVEYILSKRECFAKLLVLARFSKYTKEQKRIAGVHVLLDEHNSNLSENADSSIRSYSHLLYSAVEKLSSLRFTAPHDLDSALEILFTGKLRSLPENLKKLFPTTQIQKYDTDVIQLSLESAIKTRLAFEIIPRNLEKYMIIADGKLIIHVPDAYEVKITLFDRFFKSSWKVLDLRLFIKFPSTESSGIYKSKFNKRISEIRDNIQIILDSLYAFDHNSAPSLPMRDTKPLDSSDESYKDMFRVKNTLLLGLIPRSLNTEKLKDSENNLKQRKRSSVTEDEGIYSNPDDPLDIPRKTSTPYSICYIHSYLKHILYSLKLEILKAQAFYLNKTKWHNLLNVHALALKDSLELKYWFRDIKSVYSENENAFHYNLLKIELVSSYSQLPSIFESWCEDRLRNESFYERFPYISKFTQKMRRSHVTQLMAHKILNFDGLPDQYIRVSVCACIQKNDGTVKELDTHPLIGSQVMTFSSDEITSIDKLILGFAIREIRAFYEKLKAASFAYGMTCDILDLHPLNTNSNHHSENSMDVNYMNDIDHYPIMARLKWRKKSMCIDVLVNIYTGKVTIGVPHFDTFAGKEYTYLGEKLSMSLWDTLDSIKAVLLEFKNRIIIDRIEKFAYLANMGVCKSLPFRSQEVTKISENLPPASLFLMSSFHDNTWILISAAHKEFWRNKFEDNISINQDIISSENIDDEKKILYRVWFIRSAEVRGSHGISKEIKYASPVTINDIKRYKRFNSNMYKSSDNDTGSNTYYWEKLSLSQLFRLDIIGKYVTLYSNIIEEIRRFAIPALYIVKYGDSIVKHNIDNDTSPEKLAISDSKIVLPSSFHLFNKFYPNSKLSVRQLPDRLSFSDIFIHALPGSVPARSAGSGVIPNSKSIIGKLSSAPSLILVFQIRLLKDLGVKDICIEFMPYKKMVYDSNTKILSILLSRNTEEDNYLEFIIVNFQQISLMTDLVINYKKDKDLSLLSTLEQEYFNFLRLSLLYKIIRIVIKVNRKIGTHSKNNYNGSHTDHDFPLYEVMVELVNHSVIIKNSDLKSATQSILLHISNTFANVLSCTRSIFCSFTAVSFALDVFISIIQASCSNLEWVNPLLRLSILSNDKLVITPTTNELSLCLTRVNGMNLILLNYINCTKNVDISKCHQKPLQQESYLNSTHLIGIYKTFEKMTPEKTTGAFLCPQGVVFNSNMLYNFILVVIHYFGILRVFSWLTEEVLKNSSIHIVKKSDSIISMKSKMRSLVVSIETPGTWNINFYYNDVESPSSQNRVVSDEELVIMNNALTEKANSCETYQLEGLISFMLELLNSPNILFEDMCKVLVFEKSLTKCGSLSAKFLICCPQNSELKGYRSTINTPGQLATVMFEIISLDTSSTMILPIKYNYSTGVVGRWRESASNAEDFTTIGKMDSMMMQKLQFDGNSEDILSSTLAKSSVNTFNQEEGGPGKLCPFIMKLCSTCSSISQIK